MKTLAEWLDYIESLHPRTIALGLERVRRVAEKLILTTFQCPIIMVGGTNGKGSCVKFLESILYHNGNSIGVYTSPHLLIFNERIRINNRIVDDRLLCEAFTVIEKTRDKIPLTFFEFTTLAALWIFRQLKLDVLILEVGLGGRLDAVNVVDADIAIITSIALDHTEWLGNTREAVAQEKAGIFCKDKIAICGDFSPPPNLQIEADTIGSELYCIGRDFFYEVANESWRWEYKNTLLLNLPMTQLALQNAATSLMAIKKLQSTIFIKDESIILGLKQAYLPGRFQSITKPVACILDVAHNPAAANMLADKLRQQKVSGRIIAVLGMLQDKDIYNTVKPLTAFINEWHLASLNVPRGASAEALANHLRDFGGTNCYTYDGVTDAFKSAAKHINQNDKILVFGSFYTVAEILHLTQNALVEIQ